MFNFGVSGFRSLCFGLIVDNPLCLDGFGLRLLLVGHAVLVFATALTFGVSVWRFAVGWYCGLVAFCVVHLESLVGSCVLV